MPNTSGELYLLRHIPITGNQPAHSWKHSAAQGGLVPIPFIPGLHLQILGCTLCDRDPQPEAWILDPHGDIEFAREMKYGSPVPMRECHCKTHRGRASIPTTEFKDGDTFCKYCRLRATPPAEVALPTSTPYWKALRADNRKRASAKAA